MASSSAKNQWQVGDLAQGGRLNKQLFVSGRFSDVTLHVEDRKLALHRAVLAEGSEYFEAMLSRDFQEAGQGTIKLAVAEGSSADGMAVALEFIYCGEAVTDGKNVMEVLAAADKLQIAGLKNHCVEYLSKNLDSDNVASVLKAARQLQLANLEQKCMKLIQAQPQKVFESAGIVQMQKSDLLELLGAEEDKITIKEEIVFDGLVRWCEGNNKGSSTAELMKDFVPLIRFSAMAHKFLHQRVRQSGLVPLEVVTDALLDLLDNGKPGDKRAREDGAEQGQRRRKKQRRRRGHVTCSFGSLPPSQGHRKAHAFDTNGVLYYIGTDGGTKAYENPHTSGKVVAAMSSDDWVSQGGPEEIVRHACPEGMTNYCLTKSEANSWMSVDLGAGRSLVVDHYCWRSGFAGSFGTYTLRTWRLEGSNDGRTWTTLKTHNNDQSLHWADGSVAHWAVDGVSTAYRHFRVIQTGRNAENSDYLPTNGMELYGELLHD